MHKNLKALLILGFLVAGLMSSCSKPYLANQLEFGIWAAQNDLWDEAIFRWKRVLSENPNSAAAHNNLAVAYEKKGLWEEAKKEYEAALKLDPENRMIKSNHQNLKNNLELIEKEIEPKEKKGEKEKDEKK